ncbi:GNAT family N-acetyltransferase [Paenibacillus sp. EC2-1]|uniref:GNAT family N-acetyltransferase n=1 Tax=Paenibacillus sp. EC2-1 TaxID=3388665 RepID=UPI003BEF1D99
MIYIKELGLEESEDIYYMIQEIGVGQNGFVNSLFSNDLNEFNDKLTRYHEMSKGIGLSEGLVPQTIYWFYDENRLIGYGKLRHYLNEKLLEHGGHIGYIIRPTERRKSYGKMVLRELLIKANQKDIDKILLTCNEDNMASRKVIESNNGILSETNDGICKYWIKSSSFSRTS